MSLVDYARVILRRGWILILLAGIAAIAGYLFSQQQQPVYRSTQQVLMIPSRSDAGLVQAMSRQLQSRVSYLQSEQVAAQVIDELSLDMTPGFLNSRTTVSADDFSLLIQVDVDLEDGEQANVIAQAYGNTLLRYQDALNQEARREDRINTQLQDFPRYSQLRPNVLVNTLIGAVAGLFLGAILVFVLEYLESNIIRHRDDIEMAAELPVLASVPSSNES